MAKRTRPACDPLSTLLRIGMERARAIREGRPTTPAAPVKRGSKRTPKLESMKAMIDRRSHWKAHFVPEDIALVEAAMSGSPVKELAARYGVSDTRMQDRLYGRGKSILSRLRVVPLAA